MDVVRTRGIDIAYHRVGSGPPVAVVHGAAGDHRDWSPQIEGLADEFTVIAWDEPGAGQSSDVPDHFTLADYAHCLAAVLETVGPAHVCGLSWGGTIALELYRHHPELVASLILADTYAGWKGSLPEAEVRARVTGARVMLAEDTFDPTIPGLFAGEPPNPELLAEIAADVRPATMAHELKLMGEADQRDLLPSISVPTLLIWGEMDERSPVETVGRQFESSVPGAELAVIPECGHMSNQERPADFNALVRKFCRALESQ